MGRYLLGVDCGGGSIRCLVADLRSGCLTTATRSWRPSPAVGFFAFDIDTDLCWRLVTEVVAEALTTADARAADVAGLAVTGMRFSAVLTDRAGDVLYAVPNHDARAAEQGVALAEEYGDTLAGRTGHWPGPIFLAARLRWLAAERPEVLERAAWAFSLSDWLAYRLTGEAATDPSQAAETLLYDVVAGAWARDIVERLGLPAHLLPPIHPSGTPLGGLTARAADALGLRAGTPVAVGGADTQCGLLGAGVTRAGAVGVVAGSTAPVQAVTAPPRVDPAARAWAGRHVVPGLGVLECNAGAMGDALSWFAGVLCAGAPDPVARLLAEASTAPPGAHGATSSLGAQLMDARDMLALPTGALSLSHLSAPPHGHDGSRDDSGARRRSRADLARAVLEGMAFAVRANAERLLAVPGHAPADPPTVTLTGGMSRSHLWSRIVCDVLGAPVDVSLGAETSALGAAVCAGVGAGVFTDPAAGAEHVAKTARLLPDAASARRYDELYEEWLRLQEVSAPATRAAAGIALRDMMDRAQTTADEAAQGVAAAQGPAAARSRPAGLPLIAPLRRSLRILATADLDDVALAELRTLGEVTHAGYREQLRLLTGDDLVEALEGVDVFITEVDIADAEALVRLPDLRVLASCRGKAVNVDLTACTALGIPVLYAPGRNAEAVADLTVAFMLALSRRLVAADAFLRTPGGEAGDMGRMGQAHEVLLGHELWERTVGLVGFGAVGRAVARRLAPFGARVLVHDPFVDEAQIRLADAAPAELEQLLAAADIVSLHAPLTGDTRALMDASRLALMKTGALLVNTARAGLVDQTALLTALREGRLGGAALDVFPVEPPAADDPLLALPNVIATPHIGGNTVEVGGHQGRTVATDLRRMAAGRPPVNVLNPETLAGFSWDAPRPAPDAATVAALVAVTAADVTDLGPEPAAEGPGGGVPAEADRAPAAAAAARPAEVAATAAQAEERPAAAQMERVLRLFVERAATDEALRAFAAKKSVGSQYTVSDFDLHFHIGFGDGRVVAGMGPPPEPAKVRLKARGEVLDAILDGRLNGNKAAMTGRLSFSGDVRAAMGMQRVQKDFVRLYGAARREAGGIDFAAAARGAEPPVGAGLSTPAPGTAGAEPSAPPPGTAGAAVARAVTAEGVGPGLPARLQPELP